MHRPRISTFSEFLKKVKKAFAILDPRTAPGLVVRFPASPITRTLSAVHLHFRRNVHT